MLWACPEGGGGGGGLLRCGEGRGLAIDCVYACRGRCPWEEPGLVLEPATALLAEGTAKWPWEETAAPWLSGGRVPECGWEEE